MRLLLITIGCLSLGGLAACAQAEGVGGGGGGSGAIDGSVGGSGGTTGGSGGAGGALGGSAGAGGSGAVAGGGAGGSGGSGASGGSGGSGGGSGGSASCTPPVAGGLCDTSPQCGCAASEACQVTSDTGTTQCVPAGTTQPYYGCTSATACTKGHACVGGACKQYCDSDADCASTSGKCNQVMLIKTGQSTPSPIPGMKICSKKCDLHNPASACGPGLTCTANTQTLPHTSDCSTGGTATTAGGCASNPSACAPGYACLTSGDCKKWCRVLFASDCPSGKTCTGFAAPNEIVIDGITFGVCNP